MPETFEVETEVPAEPMRVYEAWLDTKEHAAFTGAPAMVEAWVGGRFTAHDGYIHGINLQLDPGKRIVQAWRSSEFPLGAQDSRLTIDFVPVPGGTLIKLKHADVPLGQTKLYKPGWTSFYFKAMAKYFAPKPPKEKARRATAAAPSAAKAAGQAPAAAKATPAPTKSAAPSLAKAAAPAKAAPAKAAAPAKGKPAAKAARAAAPRKPAAAKRRAPVAAKRTGSASKRKAPSTAKRAVKSARRAPPPAKRVKPASAKRGKQAKAKKSARR